MNFLGNCFKKKGDLMASLFPVFGESFFGLIQGEIDLLFGGFIKNRIDLSALKRVCNKKTSLFFFSGHLACNDAFPVQVHHLFIQFFQATSGLDRNATRV